MERADRVKQRDRGDRRTADEIAGDARHAVPTASATALPKSARRAAGGEERCDAGASRAPGGDEHEPRRGDGGDEIPEQ